MSPVTRFVLTAVTVAALLTAAIWGMDSSMPLMVRVLGAATVLLALAPGLKYLAEPPSRRRSVPFLPVVGLIYAIYFGTPFAFGMPTRVGRVTVEVGSGLITPAVLALLGWIVLLVTYWEFGRIARPKPWDFSRMAGRDVLVKSGVVLTALGLVQKFSTLGVSVPLEFAGLLSLMGTLSWVGLGFLVASWSSGLLSGSMKLLTLVGAVVISALEIGTGLVANPGRFWLLLLLAAWIGSGGQVPRRWWVAAATTVVAMMVLRGSVAEYRQQAWSGADVGAREGTALYLSIVEDRFEARGITGVLAGSAETVGKRISRAAVLADVVRRTPESVPYWGGDTYYSLVGAFVPRFLWPSKPVKNLGQRFGHRYSYLNPQDKSTSFNFPFLVEFYANFGALGVMLGMALVGVIYRLLDDLLNPAGSQGTVVGTVLGLGLLVPAMTALGSDFSLVFGGLILNGLVLYLILRLLSRRRDTVADVGKPLSRAR